MIGRIMRLVRLDSTVFEEIAADPNATIEAVVIVTISASLSALGFAILSESVLPSFIGGLINGLAGWVVWSAVTCFVGKSVFRGRGTLEQMLRVLGYASAPNALGIFAFIPCVGLLAAFGGWLIFLVAGVLAIKETLDVNLSTAIGVAIVGAIATGMLYAVVGIIFEGTLAIAAGLFRAFGGQ